MQWAKDINEFVNKKYKMQASVYMDILGEGGTICWFCDYTDLATMEKITDQIVKDQEYWQKVNQGSDFVMPGSVHDTVMRAI